VTNSADDQNFFTHTQSWPTEVTSCFEALQITMEEKCKLVMNIKHYKTDKAGKNSKTAHLARSESINPT
jgi:hypothetical protein